MFHWELFPRSATDEAWRLLSSYLERYPSQNSLYHRCVINKLLAHGIPLPNWLINSYKVRTGRQKPQNSICPRAARSPSLQWTPARCSMPSTKAQSRFHSAWSQSWSHFLAEFPSFWQEVDAAELLRLYLNYDLLEEAVDLVLEYVDAVLGKGHQYFGIEVSSPAVGMWRDAPWGHDVRVPVPSRSLCPQRPLRCGFPTLPLTSCCRRCGRAAPVRTALWWVPSSRTPG